VARRAKTTASAETNHAVGCFAITAARPLFSELFAEGEAATSPEERRFCPPRAARRVSGS